MSNLIVSLFNKYVHFYKYNALGNEDIISDGEVQWMNAGSGILHEELVPAAERLLGVQLWLNLPASAKMSQPTYRSIKKNEIPEIAIEGGKLRLLAGAYQNHRGHQGEHLPVNYYDIRLQNKATFRLETDPNESVMLFTLIGEIEVEGQKIAEKTAVKLSNGNRLTIKNTDRDDTQVLYISSKALNEPVAWAGPIVMNSEKELREAFSDLRQGRFIRAEIQS